MVTGKPLHREAAFGVPVAAVVVAAAAVVDDVAVVVAVVGDTGKRRARPAAPLGRPLPPRLPIRPKPMVPLLAASGDETRPSR